MEEFIIRRLGLQNMTTRAVAYILTRKNGALKPCQPSWVSLQPYAMIGGKIFAAKIRRLGAWEIWYKKALLPTPLFSHHAILLHRIISIVYRLI